MDDGTLRIEEKYERQGWPALPRPDLKPPQGWSLSLLTAVNRVRNHALAPDGETIAFIWDREDLSDVYVMPLGGGWPRRLSTEREAVAYWSDETPQWSPDSRWLAFTIGGHVHVTSVSRDAEGADGAVAGALPRKISDFADGAASPVWMPDSHHLLVSVERQDHLQLLLTDCEGGWPRVLVADRRGDVWDARPSPDGKWVAYTFRRFDDLRRLDVGIVEVASGERELLTDMPGVRNWHARWSPDGRWLAFLSQETGFHEIWLADTYEQELMRLTDLHADVGEFVWSPDGAALACTIIRRGAVDLAMVDVETGNARDVQRGEGVFSQLNWHPGGEALTAAYEDWSKPPDLYRVDVSDGAMTQLTFSNVPALEANGLVEPQRISFKSFDGLEIPAFLYHPREPNGAAVVYAHGGPSSLYTYEWDILVQYLVAKGYTVLCPNYRGSTGYGRGFERANYGEWGQGDVQDCLYAARYLSSFPEIDDKRVAIYGSSYGGYLVACCLSNDPDALFAAGISKYGDANLKTSWAQCNRDLRLYTEIFLGHPRDNPQVYEAGSPIHQVENVRKPVLILHGLLDDVVPPQASEEWAQALRRAGKTYEYKTYAGEPHGFLKRVTQLDAYARIERFLDWYLLP